VISLLDQGHKGPILALSRRGLLPHRHEAVTPWPAFLAPPYPESITQLTRLVRAEVRRAEAAGHGWRGVIDAMRPMMVGLWQALPPAERARFLRHLRPWWEVARHRMAPGVAERIAAARASGQLTVMAGRVLRAEAEGGGARLTVRP